ncbi:MAG TPA: DUF6504 family protein [Nocardioidaceae bacterium]|nr:DUF6504 family protein [Nocardioidaceae bacterium]
MTSREVWEMRRYDDPVEVRRDAGEPEQFLWRGRLWKVYAVVAHWVETGPWWQSADARAVLGSDERSLSRGRDLNAEREVWRVEAGRGAQDVESLGRGVFDLSFDWAAGDWRLARAVD